MRIETKDNILMVITGISFFLNIVLLILIPPTIKALVNTGYVILGIGAIFIVLSVLGLIRKGSGDVIDYGIYGVVRHPMYLGAILMFFSHILFGQSWMVIVSSIVGMVCCYLIMLTGEQKNIDKFGDDYIQYMQNVPRLNFLLGIKRLILYKRKE